jgi:hypothetical protein
VTTKKDEESEVLAAFDRGALKSVASTSELAQFKGAARATALKKAARPNGLSPAAVSAAMAGKVRKGSPDRL